MTKIIKNIHNQFIQIHENIVLDESKLECCEIFNTESLEDYWRIVSNTPLVKLFKKGERLYFNDGFSSYMSFDVECVEEFKGFENVENLINNIKDEKIFLINKNKVIFCIYNPNYSEVKKLLNSDCLVFEDYQDVLSFIEKQREVIHSSMDYQEIVVYVLRKVDEDWLCIKENEVESFGDEYVVQVANFE